MELNTIDIPYVANLSKLDPLEQWTLLFVLALCWKVTSKHLKGGKESKMDVLVMENLLFGRNVTRLYDLKGSSRSRYNPDSSGSNKVLLDQNLIEAMPTSPIFVGNKAKRLLERAVWNDTSFLAVSFLNSLGYGKLVCPSLPLAYVLIHFNLLLYFCWCSQLM